ncbi:MAG: urea ABC transporter permease subunit UrtB, partial [Acinetobacter sp.]
MNIRVNIAAIFLVFVQVICVQLVSAEQSSNSTALTAAIQQDAIQQFVQGDFAQRRALLKQWPGSIEQLDQLAEYVENEQLYSGANGQTYILESDEKLLSYPSLGIVADWPSDLSQVTLVNTLRKALNFGLAQRKLKSEDASERLEAIDIYESNLAELNVAHINALYLNEQNNKVKARLAQLKARLDYQDANVLVKIQAAKALQDSNRPDVLAMIDNELTQPNIHSELKAALLEAKSSIKTRIQASEWTGHLFSGLSTASILLLAALGLAITYGLLGVINMAHGELIMIGAYTTYVVQSLFKSYLGSYVEWYLIAAIPAAFLVSGLIGMLIERTVIRPLYGRQLETLLATFGVSLILMQLVRMTFGAQNVEVSNISWLSGGISITPSLMLPYNRIAIIVFTIAVLLLLVYLLNKTRFGLFVRAVTQNRQMARAVGIRSSRIDMMA